MSRSPEERNCIPSQQPAPAFQPPEWANMEAGPPSPLTPSDDCSLPNILTANHSEPWPLSGAAEFLTHRNWEKEMFIVVWSHYLWREAENLLHSNREPIINPRYGVQLLELLPPLPLGTRCIRKQHHQNGFCTVSLSSVYGFWFKIRALCIWQTLPGMMCPYFSCKEGLEMQVAAHWPFQLLV